MFKKYDTIPPLPPCLYGAHRDYFTFTVLTTPMCIFTYLSIPQRMKESFVFIWSALERGAFYYFGVEFLTT
jgi:hypothetical protein